MKFNWNKEKDNLVIEGYVDKWVFRKRTNSDFDVYDCTGTRSPEQQIVSLLGIKLYKLMDDVYTNKQSFCKVKITYAANSITIEKI